MTVGDQPGQMVFETSISKITGAKCTASVAQAVDHLLCKHEDLSSNHSKKNQ
jgi:hypothetical protein